MPRILIPSGGSPGHVRAGHTLQTSRVVKWSNIEDEVQYCNSGEEACAIVVRGGTDDANGNETVDDNEVLNSNFSTVQWRATTGVFDDVETSGTINVGAEWMSGVDGVITAYVASGDNRPLGRVLRSNSDGTVRLSFYAN